MEKSAGRMEEDMDVDDKQDQMADDLFKQMYIFLHDAACEGNGLRVFSLLYPLLQQEKIYHRPSDSSTVKQLSGYETVRQLLFNSRKIDVSYCSLFSSIFPEECLQWNPLIKAVEHGQNSVVEVILEHFNIDGLDQTTRSIMIKVPKKKKKQLIKNVSLLWLAVYKRHKKVIQTLLDHGADINHRASNGSTPLRVACYNKDHETVVKLLKKGADPNSKNSYGNTCLMLAAHNNDQKIVSELLFHNADVNLQDRSGSTALHFCLKHLLDATEQSVPLTLIEHGAKNIANHAGVTPLLACVPHLYDFGSVWEQHPDFATPSEVADAYDAAFAHLVRLYPQNDWEIYLVHAFDTRTEYKIPRREVPRLVHMTAGDISEATSIDELLGEFVQNGVVYLLVQALLTLRRVWGEHSPRAARACLALGDKMAEAQGLLEAYRTFREGFTSAATHGYPWAHRLLLKLGLTRTGWGNRFDMDFKSVIAIANLAIRRTAKSTKERSVDYRHTHYRSLVFVITGQLCMAQKMVDDGEADDTTSLQKLVYKLCNLDLTVCSDAPLSIVIRNFFNDQVLRFFNDSVTLEKVLTDMIKNTKDLNVRDASGQTPLHALMLVSRRSKNVAILDLCHRLTERLLEHNAHADVNDYSKRSPMLICSYPRTKQLLKERSFLSLQCTAARAVRKHKIPYLRLLTPHMEDFLDLH